MTWVFHRGSLGDSILLWPLLRALGAGEGRPTLVTDGSKAALAARELGIDAVDAEQPRFNALWRANADVEPRAGIGRVLAFGPDASTPSGGTWIANAQRMFPGASIETHAPRVDRPLALALARRCGGPLLPPVRANPSGPAVVHIGAGSNAKRWPIDRWRELADRLGGATVLAGEVEAERLTPPERATFEAVGGRYLAGLNELADALKYARVYVGADTGPTHLAAALGVCTVALFGPTDPELWGTIGPRVLVVRAPGGDLSQLPVGRVLDLAAGAPAPGAPPRPRPAP